MTAVEWLADKLMYDLWTEMECKKFIEQAKDMEAQQMINFANKTQTILDVNADGKVTFLFTPEELFEETYKK